MTTQTPAAARDNLLGICHATAQTFGFNPILLRVALMLGLLLDFEAAILTYAVMGLAVVAAALLAPTPRTPVAA
jgi:phage shock protein PspC (stress-responsive transcriptional regulator)